MKPTAQLHDLGQSLWLDNITREAVHRGTLRGYVDELSVTGLTSNPTIFDQAIKSGTDYDNAIRRGWRGEVGRGAVLRSAIDDLTQAADLFRPVYDRTNGVDGWVSLEVSPLLAYDTQNTIAGPKRLHAQAGRPNLFIKIPGTPEGLPAIEEGHLRRRAGQRDPAVLARAVRGRRRGVHPGVERRVAAGLNPRSAPWPRSSSAAGTRP